MPVIEPVNIQQILQMSPTVEKVFTELQVLHATDHIRSEEQALLDEMKATEVQDPEQVPPSETTDPDGKGDRRQVRIKKKASSAERKEEGPESEPLPVPEDGDHGTQLDIRV